jgi:GT2 family glycosyltransferase
MASTLGIVIVNWNAGRHLVDCLDCISATSRGGFELDRVVVVDNASSDGSADDLHFPGLPVSLLRNTVNRGFAAACNQGARSCSADYLLFLNPDMRVLADSLQTPIQFMEEQRNAKVGICGIRLLDKERKVSRSCSWFPTHTSLLAHLESGQVDQVMGAFFLVRRELFESLGGFDERFFVYFEDLDFSYRAKQAGWQNYYLATAQAHHEGGVCSEQVRARRLFYSHRSRILYSYKHFGWAAAAGVMLGTLFLEPFSRLVLALAHKSVPEMQETVEAHIMLWRSLPSLLHSRKVVVNYKEPPAKTVKSLGLLDD